MVTGGPTARVFHSHDCGESWEVAPTPMIQGGNMTGIFSVDFYDENRGFIVGGDWDNKESRLKCKAITQDGGAHWELVSNGSGPEFRSCVQYIPHTDAKGIFAVGIPGLSYSDDGGNNWRTFSRQGYYSIRIAPSGEVAWLSGASKIARLTW